MLLHHADCTSRTSVENLFDLFMAPFSQELGLHQTRGGSVCPVNAMQSGDKFASLYDSLEFYNSPGLSIGSASEMMSV
jgi:hypothetical protein